MNTSRAGRVTRRPQLALTAIVMAIGVAMTVQSGIAAVKARSDSNKSFDFGQARTWAWNPEAAGQVILARTPSDDPAIVRQRAEPVIFSAVTTEMPRRGLKPATGAPDLTLTYYLLLTIGSSAQTMGQFLPATSGWGLPPFLASTTSLEVVQQGSLVLDLSAKGEVVWRGVGEAQIKMDLSQEKRASLIRDAVREILKHYPPKK
jgi:hypothetical protein